MNSKLYKLMNWPRIEEIIYSESRNPHEILGPTKIGSQILVQGYYPNASKMKVQIIKTLKEYEMECADEDGFFAIQIPSKEWGEYRFITNVDGKEITYLDAYCHESRITKKDLDLFNAGIHYTVYNVLGANFCIDKGVKGTYFSVWAPEAVRVSVVGDFNGWDGRIHQMRMLEDSGVFEIFIPDVLPGSLYKFELKSKSGLTYLKSDPYGKYAQIRPDNASIVADIENFVWSDRDFLNKRKKYQGKQAPISVYEMYMGSFCPPEEGKEYANYKDIVKKLIPYMKEMGYTHVEIMPIMEHPFDASWGYQVIGYYAPTSRYGSPEDFMYFVNELHNAGIGIILDWVPAHFPRDTHGLSNFDGTCLYEHMDPRQGSHPHWGTLIYNYGRPQVSNYLIANALYWVEKFHIDGIRMDAVASMIYLDYGKNDGEWVANIYGGNENLEAIELIKHLNSIMKKRNPNVLSIAEESTAFPRITGDLEHEGLGFDLKWNMGFMNDYLNYISYDPYFRSYHHGELTFSMIYAYSEKFMLAFSHDEVVHGKGTLINKMPGTLEDKFANLRLTYGYMMTHPGKKSLFMGQEIGEFEEWNERRSIKWELLKNEKHNGLSKLYKELNRLYNNETALYELDNSPVGFSWINAISASDCFISFVRSGAKKGDLLLVVANFSGVGKEIRTGVIEPGKYKEILNTDDVKFGGSGIVNGRVKKADAFEWDNKEYSIKIKMAPLSLSIIRYIPYTSEELKKIKDKSKGKKGVKKAVKRTVKKVVDKEGNT